MSTWTSAAAAAAANENERSATRTCRTPGNVSAFGRRDRPVAEEADHLAVLGVDVHFPTALRRARAIIEEANRPDVLPLGHAALELLPVLEPVLVRVNHRQAHRLRRLVHRSFRAFCCEHHRRDQERRKSQIFLIASHIASTILAPMYRASGRPASYFDTNCPIARARASASTPRRLRSAFACSRTSAGRRLPRACRPQRCGCPSSPSRDAPWPARRRCRASPGCSSGDISAAARRGARAPASGWSRRARWSARRAPLLWA